MLQLLLVLLLADSALLAWIGWQMWRGGDDMDVQWYPGNRVAVSAGFYADKPAFASWVGREGLVIVREYAHEPHTGNVLLEYRRAEAVDPDSYARCVLCGHLASDDCDCPCGKCPYCGVKDHGTGPAHRETCVRAPITAAEIAAYQQEHALD